jgi:hypothetical protein
VDTSIFEIIVYNLSKSLTASFDPHFFKPSLPEIRVLCHKTIFTGCAIFKKIYGKFDLSFKQTTEYNESIEAKLIMAILLLVVTNI